MKEFLIDERRCVRLAACVGVLVALALGPGPEVAAQGYSVSQVPLVVPSALDPNIILTLDDSPNMARAFSPDTMFSSATSFGCVSNGSVAGNVCPANTRRFKSSKFNPLYYDPAVTYVVPTNALATATTFSAALVNGYYKGSGNGWTVDLGNSYQPTLLFDSSGNSQTFADHAAADLGNGAGQVGTNSATGNAKAYYYKFDSAKFGVGTCTAGTGNVNDDACYTLVIVSSSSGPGGADERQNFANWYSYYRTRHLAMVSAAWLVMTNPALSGTRVGWQSLTGCNSFSTGHTCDGYDASSNNANNILNTIDEFSDARRTDLQNWLRRVRPAPSNTSPSSPLRTAMARAGDYYSISSNLANNPYHKFPQLAYNGSTNPDYACRPNYHILMAGSVWNDSDAGNYCSGAACGDKDSGNPSISLPAALAGGGTAYTSTAPVTPFYYYDGTPARTNSLADIALHYWIKDLRIDLPEKLLPYYVDRTGGSQLAQDWNPKNDPATWQHMVNYVVGVGIKSTVGYTGPSSSPPANWGGFATGSGNSPGNLFDLWHAAVNSRGRFFGADTPSQIVDAMADSLSRAAPINSGSNFVGTSLATNSTRLTTDSALYQAQFSVNDWTGRLAKIPINPDGSFGCTPALFVDIGYNCTEAATLLTTTFGTNSTARKIYTWDGTAGIPFTATDLNAAGLLTKFDSAGDATNATAVVNYLRGTQANEGTTYRARSKILGDIVNSDIVFAGGENFGYQDLCPDNFTDSTCTTYNGTDNYTTYVGTKQTRMKMVYVGANDGMLHGFNADTLVEQFAYVPRSILIDTVSPTDSRLALAQLSDLSYNGNHRFFVDGSPWVGDACLKSSGAAINCTGTDWKTVLVGTTGAGGKGVFALNVSNPSGFNPSTDVLWDLTAQTDVDLGSVIGQPVIGRLNDGYYYAIFGNGYLSTRGCPVLYLVNLKTGAVRRLSAESGNLGSGNSSANCAAPNGLGRPSLFDDPNASGSQPRSTDAIYAGDMLGQLWKFDVSSTNPASWSVATGNGTPLFTARNKCGGIQPITGLIEIGAPPTGQTAGAMIYFGTGRFLSTDDRSDTTMQSFYGVWDNRSTSRLNNPGAAVTTDTTCSSPPTTDSNADLSGRKKLQEQILTTLSGSLASGNLQRTLSTTTIDYSANGNDAKNQGWYIDLSQAGERMVSAPTLLAGRIVFPTLIPSLAVCDGGGTSTVVAADPFAGGKISKNIFSTNSVVTYDSIQLTVGIVKNLIAVDSGTNVWLFAGGSSGQVQPIKTISQQQTGGSIRGRTAWREVFQ